MKDLDDLTREELMAMIGRLRGDGEATHEGGVRELFQAREAGTGRLFTVFTVPDEPRPQVCGSAVFETRWKRLSTTVPVYKLGKSRCVDDGIRWQCRRCRELIEPDETRYPVTSDDRDLGEWCVTCVSIEFKN